MTAMVEQQLCEVQFYAKDTCGLIGLIQLHSLLVRQRGASWHPHLFVINWDVNYISHCDDYFHLPSICRYLIKQRELAEENNERYNFSMKKHEYK